MNSYLDNGFPTKQSGQGNEGLNQKIPKREERQFYLQKDLAQSRLGILILAIPIAIFLFNDYQFLGLSLLFYSFVALRLGLIAYSVLLLAYLRNVKDYRSYDKSIFVYLLIVGIGNLVFSYSRVQNAITQIVFVSLAIFIIYLVVNTRFASQFVLASLLTAEQALIIMLNIQLFTPQAVLSGFLSLMLANIIAAIGSWRLHTYRKDLFLDIHERKKSQEALSRREEEFRAFVQSSSDVIYRMSPDWKEMRQLSGRDFIPDTAEPSRSWTDKYIHPDDQKHVWAAIQHAIDTRSVFELEHRVIRVDGSLGWTLSRAIPLLDKDDKIVEWFGTAKDVTERKNLEKQLQEKERLVTIGQVSVMVGHDIRSPLQAITSEIYLAKTELEELPKSPEKEALKESIDFIETQTGYINKIVADLQDYARPLKPELVEVDLCLAVPKTITIINIPSSIQAQMSCDSEELKIKTDPDFLKRIMVNLVNNAVQAMPNGGKLTIMVSSEEGKARVTVQDTGVGIPKEAKEKLFTPLFTTKAKGQGFGLIVVKRMTEALGGTISFETEVDRGTTFTITLPLQR